MIGRLRGILLEKRPPALCVELAHGLAYELEAPMSTFYRLPELGQEVILYTHCVVREDAQLLYGFSDPQARGLFRSLIKVNGVGPKLALTILSSFEPDDFILCIEQEACSRLVAIPGIGKKTAERLIIEMRDRLASMGTDRLATTSAACVAPLSRRSVEQEAVSALIALGYKPQEASRALSHVDKGDDLTVEMMIKEALKGSVRA
jgi:Holliday junction DNA helicase RuvA